MENMDQARRFEAMADKILLARFKEKYYLEALSCLEAEKAVRSEEGESLREVEEGICELQRKLNEARAQSVIEKYEFACKSLEYAKSSEDLGSAALHYEEAAKARAATTVEEANLSDGVRSRYAETAEAGNQAAKCRKKSGRTSQTGRVRLLGGIALALALLVGLRMVRETVTCRMAVGSLEMAVGLRDKAVHNFEAAYERHASEKTSRAYIAALYEAGIDALDREDWQNACEYLRFPAEEGYENAAAACAEAEAGALRCAQTGDLVPFAGCRWLVLDRDPENDSRLFLVKYEALYGHAYMEQAGQNADWEHSGARAWLNGDYLLSAFTEEDRKLVEEVLVPAEANPDYPTEAGADTRDCLYVLSISEYQRYAELINKCGRSCWLRNPGATEDSAAFVDSNKNIMTYGYIGTDTAYSLKPVMWVCTDGDR